MADIRQEGSSQRSAPQKRHKAHQTSVHGNGGWDRERSHAAPGESALLKLLFPWAEGKAQNAGPTEPAPLWSTQEPEPEQCAGESTHPWVGQTQRGRNTARAPHIGQWHLPAAPLPPHSTAEQANLNKRPPPPTCVRAEIRHCRDLQTEAK